jgi:hypothetical protein
MSRIDSSTDYARPLLAAEKPSNFRKLRGNLVVFMVNEPFPGRFFTRA